jgi:hypothetical protein
LVCVRVYRRSVVQCVLVVNGCFSTYRRLIKARVSSGLFLFVIIVEVKLFL